MPTVTPLNSWPVPVSTDLVKDGAVAIESLGDAIDASVGSGLLAWQTWAPVLSSTGSPAWANGNGVWTAEYCQIGKTVHVRGSFTFGTSTTKGAAVASISLPVTAASTAIPIISTPCPATVAGASGAIIWTSIATTTTVSCYVVNAAGTYLTRNNMTATVPATWVTSDVLQIAFTYEAA